MNALKLIALAIVVFVLSQLNQWSILDKVFFALVGILLVAWFWSRISLRGLALHNAQPQPAQADLPHGLFSLVRGSRI
jgi:hypothetical protein